MDFNQLDTTIKQKLHQELLTNALSVGGKNFFLQIIEDIKKEPKHPLLNKTQIFRYSKGGRILWNKNIYKNTFTLLIESIRKEEKDGNMLDGLSLKQQKTTINMLKTINPIEIDISPKNKKDGDGFKFRIIDRTENITKISFMFKVLFFYNIEVTKKILNYETI